MREYTVKVWDNRTEWYQNGKLHRIGGPAVELESGSKKWYQNGELHRLDGPACEYADGDKSWYQNGELHRTDGPAYEYSDGNKEYWENGRQIQNSDNIKEMTVAEIAKELGYNVKVVK